MEDSSFITPTTALLNLHRSMLALIILIDPDVRCMMTCSLKPCLLSALKNGWSSIDQLSGVYKYETHVEISPSICCLNMLNSLTGFARSNIREHSDRTSFTKPNEYLSIKKRPVGRAGQPTGMMVIPLRPTDRMAGSNCCRSSPRSPDSLDGRTGMPHPDR